MALRRDDAEPEFPPNDDHWAAYALAELASDGLEDHHRDYARRLAGLWSAEVRFDSQRSGDGIYRLTRGTHGGGGPQGTNLEGLAALWRLALADEGLADTRDDLHDRIGCGAAILISRQVVDGPDVSDSERAAVVGAWFPGGITRMDTQQHGLSGLTGARGVLVSPLDSSNTGAAGTDLLEGLAASGLIALLLTSHTWIPSDRRIRRWPAFVVAVGAVVIGPSIFGWRQISDTSAHLAVAMMIGAALLGGWIGVSHQHSQEGR